MSATHPDKRYQDTTLNASDPKDQSEPLYADPEIHFIRKNIPIGGQDSNKEAEVSQLVRKGTVLADFPYYSTQKKRGLLRSPIEASDTVQFNREQHALVAGITGYPECLYFEQEEGPDILVVAISPLVKISNNKMQASLVLQPVIEGVPSIQDEDLDELIAEAGVIAGIDNEALTKARDYIAGPCNDFEEIVFAKGKYPGEGEDASLRFEVEIGPLAGHMLDDGTIDFRDRKVMVAVREGDRIATKLPAVAGEPGFNVLGETIESKTGKDIKVKVQGDAKFLARENVVIATSDGAMSVVNLDTIKVASRVTINDDINYTTGNVASESNVTIKGGVQPGFKVEVGGDLEISGAVSNATIASGGNTVIKGGITGQSSLITADGDIDINFIERGTLKSGGLVVIRKQCYYSHVEAAFDIRCHRATTILGGVLIAGGNLTVGNVGAENCEPAVLAAGVDPGRYLLYLQLQKELQEQQNEIIQALQLLGRGARPKKIRKMEERAEETKMKLLKLNLIPGTGLYSRVGSGNDREDLDEEDPLYLKDADIENIRVEVYGKMYAGTKIMLGNRTAKLSQDVENRRYRLSKNLKRIMTIPL